MIEININLFEKEERAKLEGRLTPRLSTHIDLINVNIVEAMTGRGRTGVILEFRDENGKRYFCKTSARVIVNGIASACRGFMERVSDNPDIP